MDIKTFHEDKKNHRIFSDAHRTHFLGISALDKHWVKSSAYEEKENRWFKLEIKLADYIKEQVSINLKKDILIVRAEKRNYKDPSQQYIIKELDFDLVEKKFLLDKKVSKSKIEAEFKDGILKLVFFDLPAEVVKEHRMIEIA